MQFRASRTTRENRVEKCPNLYDKKISKTEKGFDKANERIVVKWEDNKYVCFGN